MNLKTSSITVTAELQYTLRILDMQDTMFSLNLSITRLCPNLFKASRSRYKTIVYESYDLNYILQNIYIIWLTQCIFLKLSDGLNKKSYRNMNSSNRIFYFLCRKATTMCFQIRFWVGFTIIIIVLYSFHRLISFLSCKYMQVCMYFSRKIIIIKICRRKILYVSTPFIVSPTQKDEICMQIEIVGISHQILLLQAKGFFLC